MNMLDHYVNMNVISYHGRVESVVSAMFWFNKNDLLKERTMPDLRREFVHQGIISTSERKSFLKGKFSEGKVFFSDCASEIN